MKKTIINLFCLLMAHNTFAMNDLLKSFCELFDKDAYRVVKNKTDFERIDALLAHEKLPASKHGKIAVLCAKHPAYCLRKKLFTKISPNTIALQSTSFMSMLLQNDANVPGREELVLEALQVETLELHNAPGSSTDLALDLLMDSPIFIAPVVRHQDFNPNKRFGDENEPLVSVLFSKKNFDAVLSVAQHENFLRSTFNKDRIRPGYYMLEDGSDIAKIMFHSVMGPVKEWEVNDLGLAKIEHLKCILKTFLSNDSDRMIVFKKIVERFFFDREHVKKNDVVIANVVELLTNESPFIDQDFSRDALLLLIRLELYSSENSHLEFWIKGIEEDLARMDFSTMKSARARHRVVTREKIICGICTEQSDEWLKTTTHCEHKYCIDCCKDFFSVMRTTQDWRCPADNCDCALPPSLFIAFLSTRFDDESYGQDAYKFCLDHHKDMRKIARAQIPNFRECPACSEGVIINALVSSSRVITCRACNTNFVVSPETGVAPLALKDFTNLGKCHSCGVIVDKPDGCDHIHCTICKTQTNWLLLKPSSVTRASHFSVDGEIFTIDNGSKDGE